MVGGELKESICPSRLMMRLLFPEVFVSFFFLNQMFLHFHNCHASAHTCLRQGAHLSPKIDVVIKKSKCWCIRTRLWIICCIEYPWIATDFFRNKYICNVFEPWYMIVLIRFKPFHQSYILLCEIKALDVYNCSQRSWTCNGNVWYNILERWKTSQLLGSRWRCEGSTSISSIQAADCWSKGKKSWVWDQKLPHAAIQLCYRTLNSMLKNRDNGVSIEDTKRAIQEENDFTVNRWTDFSVPDPGLIGLEWVLSQGSSPQKRSCGRAGHRSADLRTASGSGICGEL